MKSKQFFGVLSFLLFFACLFSFFVVPSNVFACSGSDLSGCKSDVPSSAREQQVYLDEWRKGDHNSGFVNRLFHRTLSPYYANHVPNGVYGSVESSLIPTVKDNKICDLNHRFAGTALYHNCNIPNFAVELGQTINSLVIPQGIVGGNSVEAKTFSLFVPETLPNNSVPVDVSKSANVYTAFEVVGYNLPYTRYVGEWDNIHTLDSARALNNFTAFDTMKLGASGTWNSFVASIRNSFLPNSSAGGSVFSLTDFISGSFGSLAGVYNSFDGAGWVDSHFDTQELNVYRNWGWYRSDDYTKTIYGGRALSTTEANALATSTLYEYIKRYQPNTVSAPKDLVGLKNIGLAKKVKYCTYNDGSVTKKVEAKNGDCDKSKDDNVSVVESSEYDLVSWKKENSHHISVAEKYGFDCQVPETGEAVEGYRSCVLGKHAEKVKEETERLFDEETSRAFDEMVNKGGYQKFLQEHPELNFNAAYNQFVCQKDNVDVYDSKGGKTVSVFLPDGRLNPDCGNKLRPPVSFGLYGSGESEQKPDGRYNIASNTTLMSYIVDVLAVRVSDFFGDIAGFATKIGNAFLSLSYSPILQKLGIVSIIVQVFTSLRESLYMPLVVIAMGASCVWMFVSSLGGLRPIKAFRSLLALLLVFSANTFLLANPDRFISLVDGGPSVIENAILGKVFDSGVLPSICETDSNDKSVDLAGSNRLERQAMCSNWFAFHFSPYIYNQWGVNYDDLSYENMPQNKQDLVSTGVIAFGGHKYERNWGLYQASKLNKGSITNYSTNVAVGVNKDLYRVVDLQLGPDNNKGSFTRYVDWWSKGGGFITIPTSLVSVFGNIVISVIALGKTVTSLISVLMLFIFPVISLFGLFPAFRSVYRKYWNVLLGLVLQRLLFGLLLTVIFIVVTSVSVVSQGLFVWMLATCSILGGVVVFIPTLLNMIVPHNNVNGRRGLRSLAFVSGIMAGSNERLSWFARNNLSPNGIKRNVSGLINRDKYEARKKQVYGTRKYGSYGFYAEHKEYELDSAIRSNVNSNISVVTVGNNGVNIPSNALSEKSIGKLKGKRRALSLITELNDEFEKLQHEGKVSVNIDRVVVDDSAFNAKLNELQSVVNSLSEDTVKKEVDNSEKEEGK